MYESQEKIKKVRRKLWSKGWSLTIINKYDTESWLWEVNKRTQSSALLTKMLNVDTLIEYRTQESGYPVQTDVCVLRRSKGRQTGGIALSKTIDNQLNILS